MYKILIYSRHRTAKWWRYIADHLTIASEVRLVGAFDDGVDEHFMPAFYAFLRAGGCAEWASRRLGADLCDEIIKRCRLLRSFPKETAQAWIGAMWQALEPLIARYKPDLVLSLLIDDYVGDIFERICRSHHARFFGLVASGLPGYVMFSTRGELNAVREPEAREVEEFLNLLVGKRFVAYYLMGVNNFTLRRFLKIYFYWYGRALAMRLWSYWKRDPLNAHFLLRGDVVKEWKISLRDFRGSRECDPDWERRVAATPRRKRLFIPLQVTPEAAIDYWTVNPSLVDVPLVLDRLIKACARHGVQVLIKDHPNMFGLRDRHFLRALKQHENAVLVPPQVPAELLIEQCHSLFTWSGTTGLQACLLGKCAAVVDNYYYQSSYFLKVDSLADIENLPAQTLAWDPPEDLEHVRAAIARRLMGGSVPGDIMSVFTREKNFWTRLQRLLSPGATYTNVTFSPSRQMDRESVQSLIESFNRYLPRIARSEVTQAV